MRDLKTPEKSNQAQYCHQELFHVEILQDIAAHILKITGVLCRKKLYILIVLV